jgi:hypothetical protein
MAATISVAHRFHGPPASANGGYICGLFATSVAAQAGGRAGDLEVTLRKPPPLERPLTVDVDAGSGQALLLDGDIVVAEASPTTLDDVVVPPPVGFDAARAAAAASRFLTSPALHPFPTCFTCGPNREPGDGLRLFASAVPGRDVAAAAWVPDASLPTGSNGHDLAPEIVWAALDCPSAFVMYLEPELDGTYVLGRFAVRIDAPVRVGERYEAIAWRVGVDGRKLFASSALFGDDGALVAFSRAVWVRLP